jgi:hypothetical protein
MEDLDNQTEEKTSLWFLPDFDKNPDVPPSASSVAFAEKTISRYIEVRFFGREQTVGTVRQRKLRVVTVFTSIKKKRMQI